MKKLGVLRTPSRSPSLLSACTRCEGGRIRDRRVVGGHVESEIGREAAERPRASPRPLAPLRLRLEQPVVHVLEPVLLGGGLGGERGRRRVDVAWQREVPHDVGDVARVLLAQLFDDRVERAAGLALEVEELDDGDGLRSPLVEHVRVGADGLQPLALGGCRFGGALRHGVDDADDGEDDGDGDGDQGRLDRGLHGVLQQVDTTRDGCRGAAGSPTRRA